MGKIRINDLARELEVKSKLILEYLSEVGYTGKKSHSSSLEDEIADKVRKHFLALVKQQAEATAKPKPSAKAAKLSAKPTSLSTGKSAAKPTAKVAAKITAPRPVSSPEFPPLRRSLEDIKAEMRKKVASPARPVATGAPASRLAPPVAGRATRPGAATAVPPGAAKTGVRPAVAATMKQGAATAKRGAAPVAQATAKAAKISQRVDAAKPLYQIPAGRAPGRPRPGMVRRPGEPHPVHPTSARAAGARIRPGLAPAGRRPMGPRGRPRRPPPPPKPAEPEIIPINRNITIAEGINVKELSEKLGVRVRDVIKRLVARGVMATINQALESELAKEICRSLGAEAEVVSYEEEVRQEVLVAEKPENLKPRAPVVTVMGHVDHGKTSLLDAIRKTNVADREAGGITQHIGAYRVEVKGRPVVFLDTPGHEAFTQMRARGTKVTDVVILVVAADDGVMPQTLEAISHAQAAKVPLLVAVNKVDKPDALPDRVRKQLADRGLMPEDWGGETVMVDVSAKEKKNLDTLLEMVLLVTDMQEVKANPDRAAGGTVLEARLDRGRGPVATVLVQNGTLRTGDSFLAGSVYGKVRAMFDEHGKDVGVALPSTPVEVLGIESVPQAGDSFQVIEDTSKAKQIALYRQSREREASMAKSSRLSLEQLHDQMEAGDMKELPVILKADVQGSVEVLLEALNKCGTEKVKVKIIHSAVGAITESDVLLASASNAVVVGFGVRPERKATALAELEKVDIRLHTVIYELTEEVKKAMAGLLAVVMREVVLGRAEVRETFRIRKVGNIAGSFISDGKITRNVQVRLLRDNVVVYQGRVQSLRRFKDDVEEVKSGLECGIILENFSDVKIGDVLEPFAVEKVKEPAVV